jgi:hypothetical protein
VAGAAPAPTTKGHPVSRLRPLLVLATTCLLHVPVACGDDDGGSAGAGLEQTGRPCQAASECFAGIAEGGAIRGEPLCLDRVQGGYCTHVCVEDADCCAVPGECSTALTQVCSPFESAGQKMCFLSCEDEDVRAHEVDLARFEKDGTIDANAFCTFRAGAAFQCRSSGGGSENRKVCVPG